MPIHLFASFIQQKHQLHYLSNFEPHVQMNVHNILVMDKETLEKYSTYVYQNTVLVIHHETDTRPLPPLGKMVQAGYYATHLEEMKRWYSQYPDQNLCIVGGRELCNYFLQSQFPSSSLSVDQLFLTEYKQEKLKNLPEILPLVKPSEYHELDYFSEWEESDEFPELGKHSFRRLHYILTPDPSPEHAYLDLCRKVIQTGNRRKDRTQVGTVSLFGTQMRFDLRRGLPLITTKRVAWKSCIEELLWFCRGDTDAKILQQKGVKIWDGNSSRTFLDNRGLDDYPDGILGPIYGWQWRFYGATYQPVYGDTSVQKPTGGVDQLEKLVQSLKKDPYGRRHVITTWNPKDIDDMALPPCHHTFQFYIEEPNWLSCHFIMRSNDLGCGTSFNLLSYAVLTHIIAAKVNCRPKELVYTCSDTHIYLNHLEQIQQQLTRTPVSPPKLWVDPDIVELDWSQIKLEHFDIIGYFPDASISMQMAV
jgi:thymidylate synthase